MSLLTLSAIMTPFLDLVRSHNKFDVSARERSRGASVHGRNSYAGGRALRSRQSTIPTIDCQGVEGPQVPFVQIDGAIVPNDGPAQPAQFSAGTLVTLSASANDAQDGELAGDAFEWKSSLDGSLGNGTMLETTLSPGQHFITLTVADSNGNVGYAYRSVDVM